MQKFLQPDSGISAGDLCGNKQGTALALQVLKRLLVAASSMDGTHEAAGMEREQISLLKKQARVQNHCHVGGTQAQLCCLLMGLRVLPRAWCCSKNDSVHDLNSPIICENR